MPFLKRKISARRKGLRKSITAERLSRISQLADSGIVGSVLLLIGFVSVCVAVLLVDLSYEQIKWFGIISISTIVALICLGAAFYIHHYERRIVKNHTRGFTLAALFILLLAIIKLGTLFTGPLFWATGTAVTSAVILTIAYNQRFAIGMSLFYTALACFAVGEAADIELFLTMMAGVVACCFSLKEIRTRTKLIEVGTISAIVIFAASAFLSVLRKKPTADVFSEAGVAASSALAVGLLIQSLLPVIEKAFRIATSSTLLDYSDANQPLLKKLAMQAPGTFSHSLLIGSVAEAAAEAIRANGLLCRVGAYYHDIGKINKPDYFVENQVGPTSRHKQLSPAMSQLIIAGHVKDGIELAREYGLPTVLRQFIETHHGTTLIEYFYHEAKKKQDDKQGPPSETEFRYPGPKPQIKEAAIVMLADTVEGAVRSLVEVTPTRIEAVVHNMAMKRLQDGQFDECELTLRELSQIEASLSKGLAAHYHSRIAYPQAPDVEADKRPREDKTEKAD